MKKTYWEQYLGRLAEIFGRLDGRPLSWLERQLEARGRPIPQSTLNMYRSGHRKAPEDLLKLIVEILSVEQTERRIEERISC
jgi:hypothetical protein